MASGGAERVVSILLNELKDKFNLTLVLMNDTILYKVPNDLKIIYLENSNPVENGMKKLFKIPFLGLKYKKICQENNIDISLSFMARANYINTISKTLGNKPKVIISERAMPSLQYKYGLKGFINRFLIKQLYPKSDAIIANSLGNSLDLTNNFNINKVTTINNPLNIEQIEKLSNEDVKLDNSEFKFITIGRLDSGKNHQLIIKSMQNINAKLYIIGDGILKKTIKNQIKELNLEKKVFLLGHQENPYKYLAKADCFIFSSNHEGFPNVLIEALACGLPIISTDCQSGPREILAPTTDIEFQLKNDIEESKYGILTPINDETNLRKAIHIMMNDNKLRDSYKQKAKRRTNCFNKDETIQQFSNLLDSALC